MKLAMEAICKFVMGLALCALLLFVPAGTWHNVVNTGRIPLKVSVIYAPPNHPQGTIHISKADADREEY